MPLYTFYHIDELPGLPPLHGQHIEESTYLESLSQINSTTMGNMTNGMDQYINMTAMTWAASIHRHFCRPNFNKGNYVQLSLHRVTVPPIRQSTFVLSNNF